MTIEKRVGLPFERRTTGCDGIANTAPLAVTIAEVVVLFVFELLLTQSAQAHQQVDKAQQAR